MRLLYFSITVPSQPRDLTVDMVSDTSVLLFWKPPLYLGGKLTKYVVFYGVDNDKKKKELKSGLEKVNVTMVVDGINNKRKYDVKVSKNLSMLDFETILK
jgi:hypothetical protein